MSFNPNCMAISIKNNLFTYQAILYFKKAEEIDPKQKDVIAGRVTDSCQYFVYGIE